ncbi:MAG: extracellular solute-binding protein [Caldilineaceae bacterium]
MLRRSVLLLTMGLLLWNAGCNRTTPTPTPTVAVNNVTAQSNGGDSGQAAPSDAPVPPTAQPTATPTPDPVGTLTLWHSWAEGDGDALAVILLAFAEKYPDIQVNTLFVAYNDLPQSYAEAVQAGAGPDLILAPNWWLGEMVEAGVVQSIDALVADGALDGALLDDFWPATLDNLRWNGELYGLPTNFELVSLFYNRALVSESALPTTTEALLALARADAQTGIGLYASLYHLYWGFPAYGAQLLDSDGTAVLDQSSGAADYLTWLAALSEVDGTYVDSDYSMLLDRFKKGEFAFLVDGPWSIRELQGALGADLAVAQLPAGPVAAAQPWLNADGIFLNPQLANDQRWLALLLARHLVSVESGVALAQYANRLPANRTVTLADPLLDGFLAQGGSAQPFPTLPEMDEVWGYGGDLLIKVLDAKMDPTQAVTETTVLINEANGK